ncbi:MAG TPA: TetR family transcriptional regulator [Solirubrobacteraceae bacterium]
MRHGSSPTPGVGGPRSEGTRRTILEAARATFATRGYEQTTIRAVAAQADIDPSMVMRYFGSKAGLFTAASTMDLHPPDLRSVPVRRRGEHIVRHFVDRWESAATDETLVFMMRTAVTNEAVAAQMQATFDELIIVPIAALGDDDAGERAALIGSQMLGLVLCRYVLRLEPFASLPIEDVVARIAPTIQRYLTQPATR